MHYYSLNNTWDNIIVTGIVKYCAITDLFVAAFAIVTANHDNDCKL